jgi:hypothetical protein
MAERRRILLAELQPLIPGAITFATWNPADKSASVNLSGGNLTAAAPGSVGAVRATVGMLNGRWYWETQIKVLPTGGTNCSIGIARQTWPIGTAQLGFTIDSAGWWQATGQLYTNSVGVAGFTMAASDTICHLLDLDARTYSIRKNGGAWITISLPAGTWYPAVTVVNGGTISANFGASPFAFAVPDEANAGVYSRAASTTTTLYLASEGFNTGAFETPAATHYDGRVVGDQDVEIEREGSCHVWGGQTISRRGQIVFANADGGLDAWRTYEWRDAPVTILSGYEGDARAAFTVWSASRANGMPEFTDDLRVVMTLADPLAALDCAMQPTLYPDTQANAQAVGRPVPMVVGRPMYCEGVLVDTNPTARNYQVDDVFAGYSLQSIAQVYDKGDLFAGPNDPYVADSPITLANGGNFTTWSGSPALPTNWSRTTNFGTTTDRFIDGGGGTLRCQSSGQQTTGIYHNASALTAGKRYVIAFTVTAVVTAGTLIFRLRNTATSPLVDVPYTISTTGAKTVTIDCVEAAQLQIVLGSSVLDVTLDDLTCASTQIIDWTYYVPSLLAAGFHLTNLPAGKVVCNPVLRRISGNVVVEKLDTVLAWLDARATAQLGYSSAFNAGDIAALRAVGDYTVASYISQPRTFVSFLRELLDGWCGWAVAKRDGTIGFGRVAEPSQTAALTLDETNIVGRVVPTMDEAKGLTVRVGGRRNHAPHNPDSDFATSVPQSLREELVAEFTVIRRGSPSNSASPVSSAYRHALAADPVATMLQDANEIQTAANRLATLWRQERSFYKVSANLGAVAADALEPGQTVRLVWPRYGLQDGKNLLVVGVRSRFFSRRVDLKLWG